MDKLNVYQKLQKARVELQSLNLKKSGENTFAKFKYYELPDFLPSINSIFNELGLFSNFSLIGDIDNGIARLIIVNTDNPEQTVSFESPIADAQVKGTTPVQSLGAVHTYLKRYLYVNALEIVESDALDAQVGTTNLVTKDEKKIEKEMKQLKKDDTESIRKVEIETTLYGTAYTLTDATEWLDKFLTGKMGKTLPLGEVPASLYSEYKGVILKKLDKERLQRIADGETTPYDHMGTKLNQKS
jgi:hypothetical protein